MKRLVADTGPLQDLPGPVRVRRVGSEWSLFLLRSLCSYAAGSTGGLVVLAQGGTIFFLNF